MTIHMVVGMEQDSPQSVLLEADWHIGIGLAV